MSLKSPFSISTFMVLAISFNSISSVEAQNTSPANNTAQANTVTQTTLAEIKTPTKAKAYNPKGPDFEPYRLNGTRVNVEVDADLLSKKRQLTINFLAQFDPDFYAFINVPMGKQGSLEVYSLAGKVLDEKSAENLARATLALSRQGKLDLKKFRGNLEKDVFQFGGENTKILSMVINNGDSVDKINHEKFLKHLAIHYPKQFKNRIMPDIVNYYKASEAMLEAHPPPAPEPGQ